MSQYLVEYQHQGKRLFTVINSNSVIKAEDKFERSYDQKGNSFTQAWRLLRTIKSVKITGVDENGKPKEYTSVVELAENDYMDFRDLRLLAGMKEIKETNYDIIGYRVAKNSWDRVGYKILI